MPMVGFSRGSFTLAVVVMHIHLHLPNVLMLELADFQVKKDKAAQQPVIEDQSTMKCSSSKVKRSCAR